MKWTEPLFQWMSTADTVADRMDPWISLAVFLAASALMIWRLGVLEGKGFEGTVLGTLIMPYCSGLSNLLFAWVMGRTGGPGTLVLENSIVNNVTNMTLLIGLPALIWSLDLFPGGNGKRRRRNPTKDHRLNRLSLLLTLIAMMFFTGITWALARDGVLGFSDGLVLIGVFLFWQAFHVFEVLKGNVQRNRSMPLSLLLDLLLILAGGVGTYLSIERMVEWVNVSGSGFFVAENIGWLSGLLMVMPNALLAFWYARGRRADVVYASQVGDGHICIPVGIGLFALFSPVYTMRYFQLGVWMILGAGLVHFVFLIMMGRLPRWMGAVLVGTYGFFLYKGLLI
jgi:cation:H+ antiporter